MSTSASGDGGHQGQLREFATSATHAIAVATSFCFSLVSSATLWSFSPFILVYPAVSYLVAPLLVFVAMVIKISILAPLSAARYLLGSLYPVYVFCGVACITGIVVGMGGRGLAALLTRALVTSEQDGGAPTDVPVARGTETRNRRRRLRIKGRDTQSFAVSCKALVATYVRRKPVFTLGFLMQKHWFK